MDFYADLSPYYEAIFPLTDDKLQFTKTYIPTGGRVLDIGCSTGEFVLALAKADYRPAGMDLSTEMIEKAKAEATRQGVPVEFRVGDMRELHQLFADHYDGIVCFGNTIVHLTNLNEIRLFFRQVLERLQPGGRFLFQIVNYDRVLEKGVKELPVIHNDAQDVTFYRNYDYDSKTNLIQFHTRLGVNGEEVHHSVALYPLTSREIQMILGAEGFREPQFFGDFAQHPYDPTHSNALVVVVQK